MSVHTICAVHCMHRVPWNNEYLIMSFKAKTRLHGLILPFPNCTISAFLSCNFFSILNAQFVYVFLKNPIGQLTNFALKYTGIFPRSDWIQNFGSDPFWNELWSLDSVWSLGMLKSTVLGQAHFYLFSLLVLFCVLLVLKSSHCVHRGELISLKSQTQAGRSPTALLISIFVFVSVICHPI